jgi:hypothetical protein
MSQSKTYTRELRAETGYTPTWLPSVPLELGTVGRLDSYEFLPVTTLGRLKIAFKSVARGASTDIRYMSRDAVSVGVKAAGQAPVAGSALTQADAGLTITFQRENAVLFLASECSTSYIADQDAVEEAILDAYQAGLWKPGYVAVTELVTAAAVTVLISSGRHAAIEFRANVAAGVPSLGLLAVQGGVTAGRESYANISTQIVARGPLTPLFRAVGVKSGVFGPDTVVRRRLLGSNAEVRLARDLDYDDFAPHDEQSATHQGGF